jgi:hypothetical protein
MLKLLSRFLCIVLIIFSIITLYGIFLLQDYIKATDISLYPVKNTNKGQTTRKTWLISFASGDAYIQDQNNMVMSASMHQVFDVIISYQPHHIEPEFYQKHQEILSQKRGVGYWLWKPYLILKTLNMMPENDILLYVDRTGIFREGIYKTLALAKDHDITLSPIHNNRGYIKKIVIDKMLNGDDSILDKPQIQANFLLLRNTPKTRKFIEKWLKYCKDFGLINDVPSKNEYPDFVDHRHDQAILTAIYYQRPKEYNLLRQWPEISNSVFFTRRSKSDCGLLSQTFDKELGDIDWSKVRARKYLYKLKNWLIGCQTDHKG